MLIYHRRSLATTAPTEAKRLISMVFIIHPEGMPFIFQQA